MSVMPLTKTSPLGKKIAAPVKKVKTGAVISTPKAPLPQPAPVVSSAPIAAQPVDRDDLITSNRIKARKLARSILRKWNARLDLQEVDSIVDLSLCEAAHRFDPEMGASFMTFLFYHLRGNLIRAISASANSNLVAAFENELAFYEDEYGDGSRHGGRSPNAVEIAEALNGRDHMLPDEVLAKKEILNISKESRLKLDNLAREVLDRIFIQEEQLIDIACSLGYSRCHISRVKRRALETLYDEMKGSLNLEGPRPTFDDDGDSSARKKRTIHRRRPRSKAASLALKVRAAAE